MGDEHREQAIAAPGSEPGQVGGDVDHRRPTSGGDDELLGVHQLTLPGPVPGGIVGYPRITSDRAACASTSAW